MADVSFIRRLVFVTFVTLLTISLLATVECGRGRRGRGRRRRNKRGNGKCSLHSMAEYKLTFCGTWSEEKFPRMYPQYRPRAQWSNVVGRTHGPSYQMWSEGTLATPALQRMAEEGDSRLYDAEAQGYDGVMDTFSCQAIRGGEGKTSAIIRVDGAHSKVSFVSKMVPSPDWFVGLDGLELCRRGRWRVRAHVNLRPMDAGTDRSYTFTSPNWPSIPREPVYQITSTHPAHPASAFLYPEYKRLPRVAYVDVERVAQYVRKGPVSPLKTNLGNPVVVFGEKTATTTKTTTTASVTTSTSTRGEVVEAFDETVGVMKATGVDKPDVDSQGASDGGRNSNETVSTVRQNIAKTSSMPEKHSHLNTNVPLDAMQSPGVHAAHTVPTPAGGGPTKVEIASSLETTPIDIDDSDTLALKTAEEDLTSLQRGMAQRQKLAEESRHLLGRIEEEKAAALNESSRKAIARLGVNDVTDKKPRRQETSAATDKDRESRQMTLGPGHVQDTSVRISQEPGYLTHAAETSSSSTKALAPNSGSQTSTVVGASFSQHTAEVVSVDTDSPSTSQDKSQILLPQTKSATTTTTSAAMTKAFPQREPAQIPSSGAPPVSPVWHEAQVATASATSKGVAPMRAENDQSVPQVAKSAAGQTSGRTPKIPVAQETVEMAAETGEQQSKSGKVHTRNSSSPGSHAAQPTKESQQISRQSLFETASEKQQTEEKGNSI